MFIFACMLFIIENYDEKLNKESEVWFTKEQVIYFLIAMHFTLTNVNDFSFQKSSAETKLSE